MRVVQIGRRLDLGQETLGPDYGGELRLQDLEGDLALVPQVVGRLLVASQTDKILMNITVIVIGIQELIMRVTYLPKKRWMRRNLYGLPPMTAEAEGRFLGVLAIDNVSSMQVCGGDG